MRKSITLTINQGDESATPKKFKVVGILDEGGISGNVFSNPDSAVIMPISTLREMTGAEKDEISQIVVRLDDPSMAEEVTRKIQEKADVTVLSLKEVLNSVASFFKVVELIFVAIGSIALLVAGFGIMNTMLMSVLERTREIGVLKSIGATRSYIIKIFLAESALIGFFGGVLGVLAGTIISKGMNYAAGFALKTYLKMPAENLANMPDLTVVPLWLVVFAVVFAVFISMLFGLYPALRASRLSPVEALRYL
jgi:putative ABC transport system permease protein